jgi:flagellar biosynthesis protein FlhG
MIDQAERLRQLVRQSIHPLPPRSRAIAITSGKGGVGKTNIAANLATYLALQGQRTAILDGDLGLANVNIVLGVAAPYDIGHVVSGHKRLSEIAAPGPAGLQVFAGGSGLYDVANLSGQRLDSFLHDLVELDRICETLFIDTGAGLSEAVIRLVISAAEVIVVTTPEPTALTDAYGIIKVITRRNPATRVRLVVNMVQYEGEGQLVFNQFQGVVERFLQFRPHYLGEVPQDPMVTRAVREQKPFALAYPNSKAAKAIERLAANLMGWQAPTAGGIRGLFQRMLRNYR